LLNKKRFKNGEAKKIIRKTYEAIARKIRGKKKQNKKIISTPTKKKNQWANSVLNTVKQKNRDKDATEPQAKKKN